MYNADTTPIQRQPAHVMTYHTNTSHHDLHDGMVYNTPHADASVAISSSVSSLRSLRLEDNARKRHFISKTTRQPIRAGCNRKQR